MWWLLMVSQASGWSYLALSCGLATRSPFGTQVWLLMCLASRPAAFVSRAVTHAEPQCLHLLAASNLFALSPAACIALLARVLLCPNHDLSHAMHSCCRAPHARRIAVNNQSELENSWAFSEA